jgi:uncharacterized membrane protein
VRDVQLGTLNSVYRQSLLLLGTTLYFFVLYDWFVLLGATWGHLVLLCTTLLDFVLLVVTTYYVYATRKASKYKLPFALVKRVSRATRLT